MATARLALPVTYVGSQITRGAVVVTRVVLLALVAASHLARPVAYVGISKRMRGRFAGLPETLDALPWGGDPVAVGSGSSRGDRLCAAPRGGARNASNRRLTIHSSRSMADYWSRSAGWCARCTNRLFLQSWIAFERLRSDVVGTRSPKAAAASRGCGRRSPCRRWRWRRRWPRRRFATPRPLEVSAPDAPSNEGLQQTRWALRSAQVPIAGC